MHALVKALPAQRLILQQAPVLFAALLIAERFYKFHSFTLECLAFLATWYALDAVTSTAMSLVARRRAAPDAP